eukprot:8163108-Prorocentrum_lima.AAC.1
MFVKGLITLLILLKNTHQAIATKASPGKTSSHCPPGFADRSVLVNGWVLHPDKVLCPAVRKSSPSFPSCPVEFVNLVVGWRWRWCSRRR